MENNPVLFNKTLVIGILILFIGMSIVSSMGYTNMKTNFSVINTKMDSPTVLLDENFSGTFPPEGWETGFFCQDNSSCCDSEPPCAHGNWSDGYYYNGMRSKAIDASNYEKCIIKFYFGAQGYFPFHITISLKYRRNETSPWIDITPWDNPIDDMCDYYETETTYDPEGCGEALQIQWLFLGYYYYFLDDFCIDDVTILGIPINNPPIAPDIYGPSEGTAGVELCWAFSSDDPDDNQVKYIIDWGDGTGEETDYYPDGIAVEVCHIYHEEGEYTIKAKAEDGKGLASEDSTFTVTIFEDENQPPTAPTIKGEISGKAGKEYEYTFNATDPDNDDVKYYINWGDNTTFETDFNTSGTEVMVKHSWTENGTYNITAKAEDINGAEGPEKTLTVSITIPRSRTINHSLLLRLFERFPLLEKLLNLIRVV